MHQGDVSIIMPTFYEDEHLGWSFANMHVLDVGGVGISGYAPGAHDVWQEGMRFPPVQIIRDGTIDAEWETYIAANVRAPGRGAQRHPLDDRVQQHGRQRKLNQIIDEFGLEAHRSTARSTRTSRSRCCASASPRCPDGVYEAVDWNEFDGHDGPDQLLELRLRARGRRHRPAVLLHAACRRSTRS